MKVILYDPFILWYHHFATSLEIANEHINKGDDVHFLVCNSDLGYCETNPENKNDKCISCIKLRNSGFEAININQKNIHYLNLNEFKRDIKIPDFKNITELKNYSFNDNDAGAGVASSLISLLTEPEPELNEFNNEIKRQISDAIALYNSAFYLLKNLKPDIIYLFNNRFSVSRPIFRAGQKLGIKTLIHERAGELNRYFFVEDTFIHDFEYTNKQILSHWNNSENEQVIEEKEKIGSSWFIERINNIEQSWFSFTKEQKKGKLPDNFDNSKRNIVIFGSCEDEIEAFDNWKSEIYNSINTALKEIVKSIPDRDFHFYFRIHPNLKGIKNSRIKELEKFNFSNLTIIPADSDIHSYALMKSCEKVITFGSLTGIEAVFLEKPSILLSKSYYDTLGSCYTPKTHEEVISLIKKELLPRSKEGALRFGYWEKTKGLKFKNYEPENISNGKFMGKYLDQRVKNENELFEVCHKIYDSKFANIFIIRKHLISIIINDQENNLSETIKSILSQNYDNWEVFTDNFDDYSDKRIKNLKNYQLSGDYIKIVSSGNILLPYALEAEVKTITKNINENLISANYLIRDINSNHYKLMDYNNSYGFENNFITDTFLLKNNIFNSEKINEIIKYFFYNKKFVKINIPIVFKYGQIYS